MKRRMMIFVADLSEIFRQLYYTCRGSIEEPQKVVNNLPYTGIFITSNYQEKLQYILANNMQLVGRYNAR